MYIIMYFVLIFIILLYMLEHNYYYYYSWVALRGLTLVCVSLLNNVKKVVILMLIMLKMFIFVQFLVKIVLFTLKIIYIMKTKTKISVVSDKEIVGTSWHSSACVCSSLNHLLKVFNLPFSKVRVSRLTDKTRYCFNLKVDGLPAFTIYDRCHFQYGVKKCGEEDKVINWHIGTFNDELAKRVCEYLLSLGLEISYDISFHKFFCDVHLDDLPF